MRLKNKNKTLQFLGHKSNTLTWFKHLRNQLESMTTGLTNQSLRSSFPVNNQWNTIHISSWFIWRTNKREQKRVEQSYPSSCRTGTKPSVWMTHCPAGRTADCCSFWVSLLPEMPCRRRSSPKFPATASGDRRLFLAWWLWADVGDISISRLLLFSKYMVRALGEVEEFWISR